MKWLNPVFAVVISVLVFIRVMRQKGGESGLAQESEHHPRLYAGIMGALLILAAAVRVFRFGEVPGGINQDGAMAAVDALALSMYGTDRFGMRLPVHLTAWGYGQMSALLSYLMVPGIRLFGLSVFTARLPMIIVSLAGVYTAFRVGSKSLGRAGGITVMFFAALNPWQIMQSKWTLDCNLLPHLLIFGFYFMQNASINRKMIYLSMVFFAASMYAYGVAWLVVPVLLLGYAIYLLTAKKVKLREAMISAGIFLFLSAPILAVILVNAFRMPSVVTPLFTAAYFPDSVRSNDLLFFSKDIGAQALKNLGQFFSCVILQEKDLPWNTIPEFGPLYLFSAPLLIAGLFAVFHLLKRGNDRERTFSALLSIWIITGVFTGVIINDVNVNRINLIFYPLILLKALGAHHLFLRNGAGKSAAAICLIYMFSFGAFTVNYFGSANDVISRHFFEGFGEAVEAADRAAEDTVYITAYTQGMRRPEVSEILTQFYLKLPAAYLQGRESLYREGRKFLPYESRYRYVDFEWADALNTQGIYVINNKEKQYFEGLFQIEEYGYYAVARPHT